MPVQLENLRVRGNRSFHLILNLTFHQAEFLLDLTIMQVASDLGENSESLLNLATAN